MQELFPDDDDLVDLEIQAYLAIPLYEEGGCIIGHMGVMHTEPMDESETAVSVLKLLAARAGSELSRVHIEQRLRELNSELERRVEARTEQMRLIADSLPVFVAYVDNDQRYRFNNEAYEGFLGRPRSEILGQTVSEVFGPKTYAEIEPHVNRALAGETVTFHTPLTDHQGSEHILEATYVPHRSNNSEVLGFFALIRDVTDDKKTETAVRELRRNLAHVQRTQTVGELTAAIAHELYQPLASIRANAQAASHMLPDTSDLEGVREILSDIVADDERAANVIARIRKLLKNEEVQFRDIDVNELIRLVSELVRRDADTRGIDIELHLTNGLPKVLGDAVQLQQVILNLLLNSFEAMVDTKDPDRCLAMKSMTHEDGGVIIAVCDCGHGIGDRDASELFEPFRSTKPDGLGMGLAISKSIVESHGGRMEAFDNEGSGATFRMVLPIG